MALEQYGAPYPAKGEVIDGKYEVGNLLGEGGMGAVAKANHLLRRAPVALKFLSPSVLVTPGAVERFLNEAVAASQIDSPHIVTIYDVGKLPSGAPYLVMEYLEGRDLAAVLEEIGGPLDIPRAIHFTLQILRAMQAAHAVGIIHRDLKPANCFAIHRDGDDDFIKLFDFGISKIQRPGETKSASLTRTNSALGTPLYMSPEQAKSPRSVDTRTDLYSTAVILYELLTCCTPYYSEAGELTEILFKLFTADPTPILSVRPDLPPALAEAIHKCLQRDLTIRPQTASEMAELLVPFADDRSKLIIDRIRHPPPPKKSQPPQATGHSQNSLAAFEKMSSPGNVIVPEADRRAIGAAATQISIVPAPPPSPPPPANPVNAASMVREGGQHPSSQKGASASAQTELDSTKNSTMTATQALAGEESSKFPMGIVLVVLAVIAIGGGTLWATQRHSSDPLVRDTSPTTSASVANANAAPTETAVAPSSANTASPDPSASASASATVSAVNPPPHNTNHPTNTAHSTDPAAATAALSATPINHLNDIGRKR